MPNSSLSDSKKINILYAIANSPEKYYTKKYILKKDGTKRELLVPNNLLKNIQKNILTKVLYGLKPSKYVKSYLKNCSIKENALPHINQKIILKLDIKDYFKNIDFEHLYNALPNTIFPPSIKVLLLKLCTYEDYLPQGAPTSPMLSNLVLKNFDEYIGSFCENNHLSYTRYCDDLTFSGDFDYKVILKKVDYYLTNMGLNINKKKTKVLKYSTSQRVTGLIVNEKLNVNQEYQNKIRQEMYYIKKYGLEDHLKHLKIKYKEKYIHSLIGRINYCLLITNKPIYKDYLKLLKLN